MSIRLHTLLRTLPKAALGVALGLGLGSLAAPSVQAASHVQHSGDDTATINRMIDALSPKRPQGYKPGHAGYSGYTQQIRRIEIPVYDNTSQSYQGDSYVAPRRPVILNYNHTYDLAVFFDFDSSSIRPEARPLLNQLGAALSSPRLSSATYVLAGHTDSKGSAAYNQWLSDRRAKAVKWYLTENFPIHSSRLIATGFGEMFLADPNNPRGSVNRRVEITLVDDGQGYGDDYGDGYGDSGYQPPVRPVLPPRPPQGWLPQCETGTAPYIRDSRPQHQNLDDFNTQRLPVECLPAPRPGWVPYVPHGATPHGAGSGYGSEQQLDNSAVSPKVAPEPRSETQQTNDLIAN